MGEMINILHVVGNKIEGSNGVGRLVPELIDMQNKKSAVITSSLLFLNGNYNSNEFKSFKFNWNDFSAFPIRNYNVVVFHGVYYIEYLYISILCRKYGVPYLVKPHSSLMKAAQEKSKIRKKIANKLFFKPFIMRSAGILFSNEDERVNSIKFAATEYIEHNGIEFDEIQRAGRLVNSRNKNRFIYLSRIDFKHKGTDLLLAALAEIQTMGRIDEISLDIYGKGDCKEELRLKQAVAELGTKKIQFRGPVFGDEKKAAFLESDIFILTSRYEGFPMAILEALDSGLPCLVTPGTNMSAVLGKYNLGWLTDPSPISIANKILEVNQAHSKELFEMSSQGYKYLNENHGWDSVVEESQNIYKHVLTI